MAGGEIFQPSPVYASSSDSTQQPRVSTLAGGSAEPIQILAWLGFACSCLVTGACQDTSTTGHLMAGYLHHHRKPPKLLPHCRSSDRPPEGYCLQNISVAATGFVVGPLFIHCRCLPGGRPKDLLSRRCLPRGQPPELYCFGLMCSCFGFVWRTIRATQIEIKNYVLK